MSDSEEEVTFSLGTLAQEIEDLKRSQRVIVVPKERQVSKFTGNTQQVAVRDFKEEVLAAYKAQAIDDEEDKINFLWSHVSRSVKEELHCHPKLDRETADDIFCILENVYGDKRTVCQLLTIFNSAYQRPGEAVRDFANRLNRAFMDLTARQKMEKQAPLGDAVLRDHFLDRLSDKLPAKHLREAAHNNPDLTFFEAREGAIRWTNGEELGESASSNAAAASTDTDRTVRELTKEVERLRSELAELKEHASKQQRGVNRPRLEFTKDGRPICLQCRSPGHIRRFCTAGNGALPQ